MCKTRDAIYQHKTKRWGSLASFQLLHKQMYSRVKNHQWEEKVQALSWVSELFEKDFHTCPDSTFLQQLSFLVSITCSSPKYPERALHRLGVGSMGQKSGHLAQRSGKECLCCLHGLPKARGSPSASPYWRKISVLTNNWNETNKIGNQNSSVHSSIDFKLLFWPSRDGNRIPFCLLPSVLTNPTWWWSVNG